MIEVSKIRKSVLIFLFLAMTIFRALYVFGFRGTNCSSIWFTPTLPCQWLNAPLEIILWGVVLFLFIMELIWDHDFRNFFSFLKAYWPIFIFVLWAFLSLFWSILFQITLYKVFILAATTVLAIYAGYKTGIQQFLDILVYFFSAICIANLIFVLLFPKSDVWATVVCITSNLGCMVVYPQNSMWAGDFAWNGIFWHRIILGAFMALGVAIFFLKLLHWKNLSGFSRVSNLIMLLLSFFLLLKSKSVAGIFITGVLVILCLAAATWLRWGNRLKAKHYILLTGLLILGLGLVFTNLDFIFGLFGRNTSITGRIPMWTYLFENAIRQRPILGYGYDAFWNLEGFRKQMTQALGFGLQVSQSDNGLVDIWLHLGILGVLMVIGLTAFGFMRGVKYFFREKTLTAVFPLLLLVFGVFANITVSMLLESDTFIWAAVVASQAAISAVPLTPATPAQT